MLKKYKQLLTSNLVAGEVKHDQFYTDENVNGYMSKKDMLSYSRALNPTQQNHLDLFFEYTAAGFSITSLPIESVDKESGETVIWTKFQLPNSPQNFRMIYHPGLLRFIKEYQQGKIKPFFTFDQLIEEALTIEEQSN